MKNSLGLGTARLGACLAALLLAASLLAPADDSLGLPPPSSAYNTPYLVETIWPGINFRIIYLRRTIQNRVVAIFRIEATKDAPTNGTLIGVPGKAPSNLPAKHKYWIVYPTAFVVTGATMTDELSHVSYPQLPPVAPRGYAFLPGECIGTLRPGGTLQFSLQFAVPPPPPPPPSGQPPPVQTLSFLLPKAVGPVAHVPLPPLEGSPANSP